MAKTQPKYCSRTSKKADTTVSSIKKYKKIKFHIYCTSIQRFVTVQDEYGETPLMLAVRGGRDCAACVRNREAQRVNK